MMMGEQIEALRKQSMQATIKLSLFLALILTGIEIPLCFLSKGFLFLSWGPLLPLLHILKRKYFFKNAQFCYGEITDVALGGYDDICMSTKIEFKDTYSDRVYDTWVYEHWGDFDEEKKEAIDEFYKNGTDRIGKKAPVFYRIKNPNKNLVFLEDI